MKQKLIIKIKKEDLPKRRTGIKPSRIEKDKVKYSRKMKHQKKQCVNDK